MPLPTQHQLDLIIAHAQEGWWDSANGRFSASLEDVGVEIRLHATIPLDEGLREDAECVVTEVLALLHHDVPFSFEVIEPPKVP